MFLYRRIWSGVHSWWDEWMLICFSAVCFFLDSSSFFFRYMLPVFLSLYLRWLISVMSYLILDLGTDCGGDHNGVVCFSSPRVAFLFDRIPAGMRTSTCWGWCFKNANKTWCVYDLSLDVYHLWIIWFSRIYHVNTSMLVFIHLCISFYSCYFDCHVGWSCFIIHCFLYNWSWLASSRVSLWDVWTGLHHKYKLAICWSHSNSLHFHWAISVWVCFFKYVLISIFLMLINRLLGCLIMSFFMKHFYLYFVICQSMASSQRFVHYLHECN